MKIFENVAQLKLAKLREGQLVQTKAYYGSTADDTAGAATYKILTSAEYGGSPDEYGDHTLTNGNVAQLLTEADAMVFGAVGDWDYDSGTGTDSTAALQAYIDTVANSPSVRSGGRPEIRLPAGAFCATHLTIPASAEFGVTVVGAGSWATSLYLDHDDPNVGIRSEVEAVNFLDLALYGKSLRSAPTGKSAIFTGRKTNNTLDVDVDFSDCTLKDAQVAVQAYGRGVTIRGGVIANITSAALEIVADADAVFGTSRNQLLETSMRNYLLSDVRTDGVQAMVRTVGGGVHKDYINDVKILGCSFVSTSRLIEGADATYRDMVVDGNSAVSCFSGGVYKANSIIGLKDTGNNWQNEFGGRPVADNDDTILNIIEVTTALKNVEMVASTARCLQRDVIVCGAGSENINLRGNRFLDAFESFDNFSSARRVINCPSDVPNLKIEGNIFGGSPDASASSFRFYDTGTQTSVAVVEDNSAPWVWDDHRIRFTPVLRAGGASQSTTVAYGRITKVNQQYAELEIMAFGASLSAGALTIDMPSNAPAAIAEYSSATGGYGGWGVASRMSGFSSAGKSIAPPQVNPSSQRIELKTDSDMTIGNLDGSDAGGSFGIVLSVRYRHA